MNFTSNQPIYTQIIEQVKDRIIRGDYPPGYQLPSRRQLAQEWKVNPNTVQKAFKEMEDLAIIVTPPNRPSIVTTDQVCLRQLKNEALVHSLQALCYLVRDLDMDLETVIDQLRQKYQVNKEEIKHVTDSKPK
ncbi:GntR family transcriptional regulator [Facklamia languida]|uniref:HTH gntR-type domain-containing protein n=1 Tax=Facklamia languida CCUG 37842 TaxID=883113 RepID=H3NGY7_9LACT|nr:GntR family transcriptional regulator [Facklamia languida]EHR38042.1 hypothetical protein HMPREF9708_00126 [Facklamia languida CCUG 37842]